MAGINELQEKLNNDTDLRKKVESAKDEKELLKVVTDAGYDVKLEELKRLFENAAKEGELSEDDLDNVAGGLNTPFSVRVYKPIP